VIPGPQALKGFASKGSDQLSHVDYRLARNSILRNFRNGRLSRLDVCDAHPELLRAANHVGDTTSEMCPICEESNVVLVSYVFGNGLAPGGHNVTNRTEMRKFARRSPEMTCYVVEVCPNCSWNHLARSFRVAGTTQRRSAAK
jgi:hypothetical protein